MWIAIDDDEDSLFNGDDNDIGDGKHFDCAKCMSVVACACIWSSFRMCDHDFCSSCVAVKLRQNVARVKCIGESSTASKKYRDTTILRPETIQVSSRNEDSRVDDISDGKHFYCAKCMRMVQCACKRYNFTTCDHDFCSRCVAVKLRQDVPQVKCTREGSTASARYCGTKMVRPATILVPPRIDPMVVIDGNGNNIGDGKHFYCAKCMSVVACACIRSSFRMCDHDFCSSCVAVKLRQNVARVKCIGESSTASKKYRGTTILRPETVQVPMHIDSMLIIDGNEKSSVDDIGDGKRFYCSKCMHMVSCACIRPSFRSCEHDFCSSCVAVKLYQNVTHVEHCDCEDDDGDLFYCNICMDMVSRTLKFRVTSCGHAFCSSCIGQYIATKLDDNVAHIECPDPSCKGGVVDSERCYDIIPSDLLDKWGFLLCESALGTKRIYCPYRECSAPLLPDSMAGAAAVGEAKYKC